MKTGIIGDYENLVFSVNQLIVDGRNCSVSDLNGIQDKFDEQKIGTEVISARKISKDILESRFVSIYLEAGDKYPYPEKVYDSSESKEVKNPRRVGQIEYSNQLFVLVDTLKSHLYISNQKQRRQLITLLHDHLNNPIEIKAIIKEAEFVKTIGSVKEISFCVEPNMFSSLSKTLSSKLVEDIYGFEAEEATVTFKYKKAPISDRVRERITDLIGRKSEFKDLTIVGKSDDSFCSVFNTDEVIRKVTVPVVPDTKTRKFDPTEVFATLIKIIKQNE